MKKIMAVLLVGTMVVFCGCSLEKKPKLVQVTDQEMTLKVSSSNETGVYTGDMVDGIPNGQGRFESQNSEGEKWYYEGSFVNGEMVGEGKQVDKDGRVALGHFENGELNGYGTITNKDGIMIYEGDFKEGKADGYGTFTSGTGMKLYAGDFKEDKYNGNGTLFKKNGDVAYVGPFADNFPVEGPFKPACPSLDYTELSRNPDAYFGEPCVFTGTVMQVIEGEDGQKVNYLVATQDWYENTIYVNYTRKTGESRILENDKVTLWGIFWGLYTYESVGKGNVTIPLIECFYVAV